jgi:hypothetical protein
VNKMLLNAGIEGIPDGLLTGSNSMLQAPLTSPNKKRGSY